ncbi:hypothetical protein ES677_05450 [Bizionia gelidisalsuginis]|uniref:Uncharacterized protein n=1 Tax=Bizionia gelidisalsuginis TaxID=291188 RepID=A0ABY3MC08_9FLAO|nr:hypothetical protein [Bizionia gelidisalsuginis]TYC14826.1 hypothetical protein ES677_05450 [Bizionia gelidisalsuginis]
MPSPILELLPNLISFNYETHYDSLFINQNWVLVNGISEKKATYVFKEEDILTIQDNDIVSETSWSIHFKNIFSIETEDGNITVKAYFKDTDVLVLEHQDKDDYALFINEDKVKDGINSIEDVTHFLKSKYHKKAKALINDHEFYYIENFKEFGPFTAKELVAKAKDKDVSVHCFIRDVNDLDYGKRLRVRDLLHT